MPRRLRRSRPGLTFGYVINALPLRIARFGHAALFSEGGSMLSIADRTICLAGLLTVFWVTVTSAQARLVIAPPAGMQPTIVRKQDTAPLQAAEVTMPTVIREVKPNYTLDAMRAKIEGTVLVTCVVKRDGTVDNVRIVRSLDPTFGLDDEALKAARQWVFRPGTRNGEPVPVQVTIELSFHLRDTPPVTDTPVPLAWPEAFGTLVDSGGVRDAAPNQDRWTVVNRELPDIRAQIAYPNDWKVAGSFATGPLMLTNREQTIEVTVSLDAQDTSPAVLEPVTRLRLQQFSDRIRQVLAQNPVTRNAQLQLVAEGQVRLSNRMWVWADFSASGITALPFDRLRQWFFLTYAGERRVLVGCWVTHQREISDAVFENQVQSAGSVCGQILSRVSLETR